MMARRRAALFVDGSNFYLQCKHFINNPFIDFSKLQEWLSTRIGADIVRMYYYNASLPKGDANYERQKKFFDALRLRNSSVELILGWIRKDTGEEKLVDTNIVADMMWYAFNKSFDIMVLISGDGDIVPGVKYAKDLGTSIYVASFIGDCANSLMKVADYVIPFDKHNMRPLVVRAEGAPLDA